MEEFKQKKAEAFSKALTLKEKPRKYYKLYYTPNKIIIDPTFT